ncbi:LacI family DNA-binding transcriptional regulator [uncultured Ruegeria sp.]|uniref:LacI family DNA-binding transcriptional regulator n=1 Tax=uncultured Ruegeria sp. TaxID=259304 RepID=UPI00261A0D59|nr:LacI family DNA-binding transcriptional regulator [uncultured Ruegeria sp.]
MQSHVPNTKKIAELLGLSRATVSNVINGKGRVSKETRRRVEKQLAESGYVRDQGAVALKTGKSRLVGVLVTDISNPFYGNVISDLESFLSTAGYSTILGQSYDDKTRQAKLLSELVGTGVAGLIVNPSKGSTAQDFDIPTKRQIPTVFYVRGVAGSSLPLVSLDDKAAGALLAEHLLAEGYRRIAVIGGYRGTSTFQYRLEGVEGALKKIGTKPAAVCTGPVSEEFGFVEMRRLLEEGPHLDAVIGHNDLVAFGCLRAVRDAGRIPGIEIGLAGFDNLTFGRVCDPPLTTVDVRHRKIGVETGRLLLSQIANWQQELPVSKLEPALVVRGSTSKKSN